MIDFATSIMIAGYFAVFYLLASVRLRTAPAPRNGLDMPLLALVVAFASMPFAFNIERQSGTAVLEEGMSASNLVAVALTLGTAAYLACKVLMRPDLARLPFAEPYLPFTLMALFNVATAAWSIVPVYTLYRSFELLTFYVAIVVLFDQARDRLCAVRLLSAFVVCWIFAVLVGGFTGAAKPSLPENLMSGVFFSSAKNNMMPLVCVAIALLALSDRSLARRSRYLALSAGGFVAAGSAASTGALIGVAPAMLMASGRKNMRLLGVALFGVAFAIFVLMVLGVSRFPLIVDILSFILQKPAVEIMNATGRATFWPTFLAATEGKLFGSGFSAADRFIQLLIPTEALTRELGLKELRIASAHNMYLSAWAGGGVAGLCFTGVVIVSALRYASRASLDARRAVIALVLVLALNGMTTPGIFFDWNVNIVAFVAVLSVARRDVWAARLAERTAQPAPETSLGGPLGHALPHARPA